MNSDMNSNMNSIESLKNFYFTFGTYDLFPFKNGYIMVKATSEKTAVERYRKSYPDVSKDTVNCSFIYDEETWFNKNMNEFYDKPFAILSIDDIQ